ncbi:RhoGEF domain [Popillia japonica]|uniref:RhoGEF domain n=1 Tax=Popillia japonica TaxID=7064 RepID=A0AAW1MLJ0_POPJA
MMPLHESNRRRSPLGGASRRAKATSTPQLLDPPDVENRKWNEKTDVTADVHSRLNPKEFSSRRNLSGHAAESVLQKFRKTFSLRFQKKGSKETGSSDLGDVLPDIQADPSEDDSCPTGYSGRSLDVKDEQSEQKYKFGPLIWRSSKERKKLNKAARSAKCNSGDSGIQIEMAPGCGGGTGGDSSESHDTDQPGDELDSPPAVRRRGHHPSKGATSRPHSDLLNQILIDKFKAELKSRAHRRPYVRRTHSDLGGQRILHWESRSSYRRLMSSPAPIRGRPQSPRKKPPDTPGGVQLRGSHHRRGQLRRSLSQPLDIDKLSPLMRLKAPGFRTGGSNVVSEDEHDRGGGTSDDDMMSDSESSIASLNERKKSLELAMDEDVVILAEAVFDHVAIEAEELAFRAGDVIEVQTTANRDWWWGSCDGKSGWFPAAFVRLRVSQEDTVEDCLAAMASGKSVPSQIRRRTSISLLSNDQVRTSVVRELVHTERDFVKVLQDVAEGYIAECRKRKDMFSKEQIDAIFINLENILRFQTVFLKDLEACIDWDAPHKSCVGGCFIKHKDGFTMYSDYCNSHPIATATLQELYQFNNYSKFFEACRLMRGLIEIPLDGYLLTPVQRICKYPLQLGELLKYTKTDHPDYENIKEALEAMRGVAVLINERKRRMESLEKLAAWQQRVEGWEGVDLIEESSQLIHQGEVIRVTTGMWTSNIILFLFDHQLIYCKKDILKRNTYVYKGRVSLDTTEVIDVPDGKDIHIGVTVRHAIKLYSVIRDKWLLFCCRSSSEKQRWLEAFVEERKLVNKDKSEGVEFPPAAKQLARVAARCQRRPPRKPGGSKNYKTDSAYMGSLLQLNTQNSNSLGRKVGTWFTFGGNKKTRHQHRDVS